MSPHQHVYDRVIGMMADLLCLSPQVDPADDAQCRARWRQQRIAEIAIQEFGPDAKAIVQARLARDAGDAERGALPPAIPVSMTERRDGVCVSGCQIEEGGGANDRCQSAQRDVAPSSMPLSGEVAA